MSAVGEVEIRRLCCGVWKKAESEGEAGVSFCRERANVSLHAFSSSLLSPKQAMVHGTAEMSFTDGVLY